MRLPSVPFPVLLRHGELALLRPLRPEDRSELAQAVSRLSERTRYLRFHSLGFRLGARELDRLVDIDQQRHVAWVLLDAFAQRGIALGRYIEDPSSDGAAEIALTVCDRYQGRGCATPLIAALCASAMVNGIERFQATFVDSNHAVTRLLDALGISPQRAPSGLLVLDAPTDPWRLPRTPATEAIRRLTSRLRTLLAPAG